MRNRVLRTSAAMHFETEKSMDQDFDSPKNCLTLRSRLGGHTTKEMNYTKGQNKTEHLHISLNEINCAPYLCWEGYLALTLN